VLAALALAFFVVVPARGDGFIVIHNPPSTVPGHFPFAPLEVSYHHVSVEITDQVAVTSVDQEFYNPNNARLEGTYLFPLTEGSHIDKFSMDVNGSMMDAELLPADKARAIYEEIVRKYRDPALLEYVGRSAFKVRIFPIEPNGRKHVKLQYTQLLKSDTGLTEYAYPLNTEKFSARPLRDVSIKINLACKDPLKSIYSPSHNVEIKRDGDRRAVVGFEDKNVRPDTDFKLIFSEAKDPVGVNLLTYRNGSDDGYFLLLASPGLNAPAKQVQAKDICFVLDTSGSMAGPKMNQAKKALTFCLANLNPTDRFEIIRFSTEADNLFGELKPANRENVEKATSYVKDLKPIGGTAISEALEKALAVRGTGGPPVSSPSDRPYLIIFLTDGQPTVGETREDAITAQLKQTGSNTRIFSFGIGTDVNTVLLDRIANDTHAFSQYVLPEEDIEVKLSNFFTKIREPVLSNVHLTFTGDVKVSQLYPPTLPDLFKGEMLIGFGRYALTGPTRAAPVPAAVKITGTLNGEHREFVTDVSFTTADRQHAFIPRLWATRRVGWLLDEIRLHGESAELKDEVIRLAREHGIVTPYTAYLILEDEARRGVPLASQTFRELAQDRWAYAGAKVMTDSAGLSAPTSGRAERAGELAVRNARAANELKYGTNEQQAQQEMALQKGASGPSGRGRAPGEVDVAERLATIPRPAARPVTGYRLAQNYAQQVRVLNGRTFYQNGNTWTDAVALDLQSQKKQLKQQRIEFNSDAYFALLKSHPEAAAWLALGNEVDVVLEDTLYQVRDPNAPKG
jgi:Ca-activated chloride channel family protein